MQADGQGVLRLRVARVRGGAGGVARLGGAGDAVEDRPVDLGRVQAVADVVPRVDQDHLAGERLDRGGVRRRGASRSRRPPSPGRRALRLQPRGRSADDDPCADGTSSGRGPLQGRGRAADIPSMRTRVVQALLVVAGTLLLGGGAARADTPGLVQIGTGASVIRTANANVIGIAANDATTAAWRLSNSPATTAGVLDLGRTVPLSERWGPRRLAVHGSWLRRRCGRWPAHGLRPVAGRLGHLVDGHVGERPRRYDSPGRHRVDRRRERVDHLHEHPRHDRGDGRAHGHGARAPLERRLDGCRR